MTRITVTSKKNNLIKIAEDLKTLGYRVVLYTPQRMMVWVTAEPQEQVLGLISLLALGATVTVSNN